VYGKKTYLDNFLVGHSLILVSIEPLKWRPISGKVRITEIPCENLEWMSCWGGNIERKENAHFPQSSYFEKTTFPACSTRSRIVSFVRSTMGWKFEGCWETSRAAWTSGYLRTGLEHAYWWFREMTTWRSSYADRQPNIYRVQIIVSNERAKIGKEHTLLLYRTSFQGKNKGGGTNDSFNEGRMVGG